MKRRQLKGGLPTIIDNWNIFKLVRYYINDKQELPEDLRAIPIGEWDVSQVTYMNNLFSNVQLGLNSVVVVDSVSIPALITAVADPFKYVRICDISDNVYDTERKDNNNAIVLISKSVNAFTDFSFLKNSKKFRIPPNFLSKGYIEFEVVLQVSSIIAAHVRFVDSDFAVSLVVYEEDFEDSNDTLLAPPVPREPQNKYFNNYFPNYNNT
jgi:hypothetical protein